MSRLYDFKAAALALPGVQRLLMADMSQAGSSLTDYSPAGVNAKFNYATASNSVFNYYGQQQPVLRRQRDRSYSVRARDHGGRGVGNYIDLQTTLALNGQSFWQAAAACITSLDQPHCLLGFLCTTAGGPGNAFALIVNTDGSVSCGFDTTLANLPKSAPGVWTAPWSHVAVVSFNAATGELQVYVDGQVVIDVTGQSGITNAAQGWQRMGLLAASMSGLPTLGAALAPGNATAQLSSTANCVATGGQLGLVKNPLPGPSTLWSPDYTPDFTQDFNESFAYGSVTDATHLAGVSANGYQGAAAGTYPSGATVAPYVAKFERGFYGPWAIGVGTPLTSTQAIAVSQASGLMDKDIAPVFSRRFGHRNRKLPKIRSTDLAPNGPVDANSASFMATLNTQYNGSNYLNTTAFTEKITFSDDTASLVPVINHHCSKTQLPLQPNTYLYGYDVNMGEWLRLVPIPAALLALPQTQAAAQIGAAGSDHDAVIVHRARGRLYSFWGPYYNAHPSAQPPNANNDPVYIGDGRVHCRWGGVLTDVDNQDCFWDGANAHWGASASSAESFGGLITVQEARSLRIEHILDAATSSNSNVWRWPAQRTDGISHATYAIQEGMIIILPADVAINPADFATNPLGLAVTTAFQEHGIKIRDTNTGTSISLYGEPGDAYIAQDGYNPWTGKDALGNQVIPASMSILGPHSPSNLIPTKYLKQGVILDAGWYQAWATRRQNPAGRRR